MSRQTRQHEVSFTQLGRSSKPSVGLHKRPLKVAMHTILTLLKVLTQSLKLLRLALNSQGLDFFFLIETLYVALAVYLVPAYFAFSVLRFKDPPSIHLALKF